MRDVDLANHKALVVGKGNKKREVYFGNPTFRALTAYFKTRQRLQPDDYLFRGKFEPCLTRNALLHLMWRLGETAGLSSARCCPHTMRHTFAVFHLRRGGDVFTLQHLLGHTDLTMTRRYVAIAACDEEAKHRACSPAEHLSLHRKW